MATSLQAIIDQISPLLGDRTGGTVEDADIMASVNRCNRILQNRHGIYASKNRSTIDIFPTVYEYAIPTDFSDIISLQDRGTPIAFSKKTPREFWLRLNQEDRMHAIDTITGDRFLLAKYEAGGSSAVLHDCDSLTSNGTWAVASGTDAENISADTLNKKVGSGSLSFDIDVSDSVNNYGAIENSTFTAVDLSAMTNKGTLFAWVYFPSVTYITSVLVRWGSSSANYYEQSATTQHNGQAFRAGWNRLGFAWSGSTTTGTPVDTAIDYLLVRVVYSASQTDATGFKVDDIRMETPAQLEINYHSSRMVESAAGSLQDDFALNTDVTLLADEDADLLFYYALSDSLWIYSRFEERKEAQRQFEELLGAVRARYASERPRSVTRWI